MRLVRADRLLCLGILSSAFLHRQEAKEALDAAERGLAVLREVDVVWGSYVYGVVGIAEVLLARWAEEKDRPDAQLLREVAGAACVQTCGQGHPDVPCLSAAGSLVAGAAPRFYLAGRLRRSACGATPHRRRKNCRCRASLASRSTKSAERSRTTTRNDRQISSKPPISLKA